MREFFNFDNFVPVACLVTYWVSDSWLTWLRKHLGGEWVEDVLELDKNIFLHFKDCFKFPYLLSPRRVVLLWTLQYFTCCRRKAGLIIRNWIINWMYICTLIYIILNILYFCIYVFFFICIKLEIIAMSFPDIILIFLKSKNRIISKPMQNYLS